MSSVRLSEDIILNKLSSKHILALALPSYYSCFASNIFAKELRYYLLFDEKYFDLEETHALAIRVGSLLHLFAMPASNL